MVVPGTRQLLLQPAPELLLSTRLSASQPPTGVGKCSFTWAHLNIRSQPLPKSLNHISQRPARGTDCLREVGLRKKKT